MRPVVTEGASWRVVGLGTDRNQAQKEDEPTADGEREGGEAPGAAKRHGVGEASKQYGTAYAMSDDVSNTDRYLTGQLLIAMPNMSDPRFARTVIYMCAHSSEGAMGLVINKPMTSITFAELLQQLDIDAGSVGSDERVQFGGPVESGRGFVLHSADFVRDGTMVVDGEVALTATIDILRAIAQGEGPRRHFLALGYAGWGPGQLDAEIQANGWLHAPADEAILFDPDLSTKWERAIAKLGVTPAMLSGDAGHA